MIATWSRMVAVEVERNRRMEDLLGMVPVLEQLTVKSQKTIDVLNADGRNRY